MDGLNLAIIVSVCVGATIASILPPNYPPPGDDGDMYPMGPGGPGVMVPLGPEGGMYQMGSGGEGGMLPIGLGGQGALLPLGPGSEGAMLPMGPGGQGAMVQMGPGEDGGMIPMGPGPIAPGYPGSVDDDQMPIMNGPIGAGRSTPVMNGPVVGHPGMLINGQVSVSYPGLVRTNHVGIKYPGHTRNGFMATVVSSKNGQLTVQPAVNTFARPGQKGTTIVRPGQLGATLVRQGQPRTTLFRTGLPRMVGHQSPVLHPALRRKVVYPVIPRRVEGSDLVITFLQQQLPQQPTASKQAKMGGLNLAIIVSVCFGATIASILPPNYPPPGDDGDMYPMGPGGPGVMVPMGPEGGMYQMGSEGEGGMLPIGLGGQGALSPFGPGSEGAMLPMGPGGQGAMVQMGPAEDGGMIAMGPGPIAPGYPGSVDDDQMSIMNGPIGTGRSTPEMKGPVVGHSGMLINGQVSVSYPGLVRTNHVGIKYPGHTRNGFMATVVSSKNGQLTVQPAVNTFARPGQSGTTIVRPGQLGATLVRQGQPRTTLFRTGLPRMVGHQGPVLHPALRRKVVYPVIPRRGKL
ncbi:collagen alpha-1(XVII) chain-like [Argopecten irradians]|uniref:collagen alpha-1(XVII) chain-like n=1 Tax=Argopecten irradians TaxID=31199 RepID=UPI0037188B47